MLPPSGIAFLKGHGTGNDFVVIPDHTGILDLPADLVAAICDRRTGLGADGVLRVVPTAASPEVAALAAEAEWFMDYRNADGSLAEMCGNGVRVYARYLHDSGLVPPGPLRLATRHGVREVLLDPASDHLTADMGVGTVAEGSVAVTVAGGSHRAVAVDLGNPHAVVVLADPVDGLDLSVPPVVESGAFPAGVNVELVNVLAPGRLAMRVIERGVGETRSCGTGACAAALVAGPGRRWLVDLPGGRLEVGWSGDRMLLSGPAVLVADGVLRPEWLRSRGVAPPATASGEAPTNIG